MEKPLVGMMNLCGHMVNILAAFFSLILVACNGPLGKPIQIDDLESSGSFSNILNSKNESLQLVLLVSPT